MHRSPPGLLCAHVPRRSQGRHHVVPSSHRARRQSADSIRPGADIVHMSVRDARAVAADAGCVAGRLRILESRRRRKVQIRVRS